MEIFKTVIENTNTPQIQELLKSLDNTKDVLLTSENTENQEIEDVQIIKPINQIETLGNIPSSLISEIKDKCGDDVTFEISDYEVTYDNGVYGLEVDLVVDNRHAEVPKSKNLPWPILILVGVLTGLLTIILVPFDLVYIKQLPNLLLWLVMLSIVIFLQKSECKIIRFT